MASKEGWTVEKAEQVMKAVMDSKPALKNAILETQANVKKKKYVETMAGFRRRLTEVDSDDKGTASRSLRQAFNARVQGSGAYCTNTALIELIKFFRYYKLKSKVILTVHDSIVVDCHPDEIDRVPVIMKFAMEKLKLPQLVADNQDGQLNVPEEYDYGNGTYRFPLRAELELGANYHDDVEYDAEQIKDFQSPWHYATYKYFELMIEEHADYYKRSTTDKQGNPVQVPEAKMQEILKEGLTPEMEAQKLAVLENNIKPMYAKVD